MRSCITRRAERRDLGRPSRALALAWLLTLVAGVAVAEPLSVTLYLRADGMLGATGRAALLAAQGALARLPGSSLSIFIEPRDRNASFLAEALAAAPGERGRARLLGALLELDGLRWADPSTLEHAQRTLGLPLAPRPLRFGLLREPSPAARALMRRPGSLADATSSFAAVGGRRISEEDLDELARAERLPDRDELPPPVLATGLAGRLLQLSWDHAQPPCELLPAVLALSEAQRVSVLVVPAPGGEAHPLDAPFRLIAPARRLALASLVCEGVRRRQRGTRQPGAVPTEAVPTEAEVAWLLQAAGVAPEGLPSARRPARGSGQPEAPPPALLLDGIPATRADLAALWRPRSLRVRLLGPATPRGTISPP